MYLNGMLLGNNSIVLLSDIGEGSGALYCLTDRTLCCGANTGGANRGIWRFPDGTNVEENSTADIYFIRSFSSLPLSRRSSAVGPTGVYTCVIPDASDILKNVAIEMYGALFLGRIMHVHEHDASIMNASYCFERQLLNFAL
jgi:hypothetical protein